MTSTENERRVASLVHTGLFSAVGVYALLLVFFRAEIAPEARHPASGRALFLLFASIGVAQFLGAVLVGKRLLRSRRSDAGNRVRLYFLLRAAAAEAIALYGFVLGFLGGSAVEVTALFGIGIAALLSCAPSRPAWEEALREASGPPP